MMDEKFFILDMICKELVNYEVVIMLSMGIVYGGLILD